MSAAPFDDLQRVSRHRRENVFGFEYESTHAQQLGCGRQRRIVRKPDRKTMHAIEHADIVALAGSLVQLLGIQARQMQRAARALHQQFPGAKSAAYDRRIDIFRRAMRRIETAGCVHSRWLYSFPPNIFNALR